MTNNDMHNQFGIKLCDLIDEHKEQLSPQDVAWLLIESAVSCSLCCAPNELEGIKFILQCVQDGISSYEATHS